ncbi:dCTP deaminase [Candidatus Saccharibacteria bacterium]|nr:dCTP deaminase [Candidatus Saccharibacteria bacterium]
MILTGSKIAECHKDGIIVIEPFDPDSITTDSYDFHLGNILLCYKNHTLDARQDNETEEIQIPEDGIVLEPGKIYLGSTLERIGSKEYVPIIRGKSSTGRLGLFVHITADLIDIGSINQYTLMMNATQPVKIYPGMPIGQVTFWVPYGNIDKLYDGKYNGLEGPQASQSFRDFS